MLRRHAFPLILLASAVGVAGCSPSGSGNITATDNESSAALTNEVLANDEGALLDNDALGNVVGDNVAEADALNAN
ncbi:hypothetical protein [Sphingomonas sp. GM_Shp_1]|uniref:hypothetical protein n=1 Tax=Sphingomonas sp. GM_Shp_1 TaxID=2937381 RepID=UPI00226B6CF2|nr:hypothetical protein [Sphingomonas sp. GM_Shp_1]